MQFIEKIRPSARHILTIGEGIIKDYYTAVLELVKNAYDADATQVDIIFDTIEREGNKRLKIIIKDNGNGMDNETIVSKWLVPSTDNKVKNPESKYLKRKVQGRKGIGRYAVSILGNDMTMITVDKATKERSTIVIDWDMFKDTDKFLDEIDILLETQKNSDDQNGTYLEIQTKSFWTENQFLKLIAELKKLIPPRYNTNENELTDKERFDIYLYFKDLNIPLINGLFDEYSEPTKIKPAPLMEYYHYRIHGSIDKVIEKVGDKEIEKLVAKLHYINNYEGHELTLPFNTIIPTKSYCGKIDIDIRVFDRDTEGLNNLKSRSSLDITGKKMRQLLDEFYGIRVYKRDFRVRPYGDKFDDWLNLNGRRVNEPTRMISANQVLGIVKVEEDEISGLVEKATREGFKENEAFKLLQDCVVYVLRELEVRRYQFRKMTEKGRTKKETINKEIEDAINFDTFNDNIDALIGNLPEETQQAIRDLIQGKAKEINDTLEDVQDIIAIYQQKIMLGKLVSFLLHEGRRPLKLLKDQGNNLPKYSKLLQHEIDKISTLDSMDDVIKRYKKINESAETTNTQSKELLALFKLLEPLASEQAQPPEELNVFDIIEEAFIAFKPMLAEKSILYKISGDKDLQIKVRKVDLRSTILGNMIDNSIYWVDASRKEKKEILVSVSRADDKVIIDFQDNGLGISKEDAESRKIFEPGFSKKIDGGFGLGLSIAGEATERNKGSIKALPSSDGAYFRLEFPIL